MTPAALARQDVTIKVAGAADIITDAFIISIPIMLLWNVRISLRRKLALGAVLSLSAVMIVVAIIRLAFAHNAPGQIDAPWVFFWIQVEACVAVIVVSGSSFRTLFVSHKAEMDHQLPQRTVSDTLGTSEGLKQRLSCLKIWRRSRNDNKESFDVSRRQPEIISPVKGAKTESKTSFLSVECHEALEKLEMPLQVHVRSQSSSSDNVSLSLIKKAT